MKARGKLLGWFWEAPSASRRSLAAAALGWMLDSFDVMLYSMVLAFLMKDLGMGKTTAGLMGSITLVASAAGGVIFGLVADRMGRTKALRGSILIYSLFTAACGLAASVPMLAVFRVFLGLGMGGEWASGAALVSETWPAEHRGKVFGIVQSFWAVGYALAALVTAVVYPWLGWRAVFFVGVLPALLVFWIQSKVEEPRLWKDQRNLARGTEKPSVRTAIRGRLLKTTILITVMNAATLFAWWGFNLWIPGYLSLAPDQGGIGLAPSRMSALIVFMQVGMWLGYLSFGYISDRLGRRRTYAFFLVAASVLVFTYAGIQAPTALFFLGPFVAFFGTGYFSGFGALTAELYPTSIRATLQGFTYNIGRVVSAAAPLVVGSLAQTKGFGTAFLIVAVSFILAAVLWIWIPETGGRELA